MASKSFEGWQETLELAYGLTQMVGGHRSAEEIARQFSFFTFVVRNAAETNDPAEMQRIVANQVGCLERRSEDR